MDKTQQIKTYIQRQRLQGVSDEAIRSRLATSKTVTAAQVDAAFTSVSSPSVDHTVEASPKPTPAPVIHADIQPPPRNPSEPVREPSSTLPAPHHHVFAVRHRAKLAIVAAILACLVVLAALLLHHKPPTIAPVAAQRSIQDPNYSLQLPLGWYATSDYKPGAGLSTFYQRDGKGTMVVYVLPLTKSGDSSANHASARISELSGNGASSKTLSTDAILFGGTHGSITTVLATSARSPATQTCYLFGAVDYSNVAYNIDVTANKSACSGTLLGNLKASIASFRPKTADLAYHQ